MRESSDSGGSLCVEWTDEEEHDVRNKDGDEGASTPVHASFSEALRSTRMRSEIRSKIVHDLLIDKVPWVVPAVAP